jgi:hypothetical protein
VWGTTFTWSWQGVDAGSIDILTTYCFAWANVCIGGDCVGPPVPTIASTCSDYEHIFDLWDPTLGYCDPPDDT